MPLAVCVYCGARVGGNPLIERAAVELGAAIATRGWRLVYGGGNVGLMGELARSALAAGGPVTGIIPRTLLEREQGLTELSDLVVTDTLRQRKALMDERADAFITLPGGFGTLEETVETLTLRQLRYHDKPIVLLNLAGYYDPLLALFAHMIDQGFAQPDNRRLYTVVSDVESAITAIEYESSVMKHGSNL